MMTSFDAVLALGELEASASAALTIFLAFNHARIAGEIPVGAKRSIVGLIDLAKRAGDTVAASAGLTIGATALNVDQNVELVLAGSHHEGLTNHHRMFALNEILGKVFSVNNDFAGAFAQKHASYGRLPSTGTDSKILDHLTTP